MARPLIALLSDFGLRDPYVGAMKGAILSVCREATLVDVAHDLPPHDITAAALALEAVFPHFPEGTAFVVVVDPGVGSARRGLAGFAGGRLLVGPDNGAFELVIAAHDPCELREISNPVLLPGPVAPTFHGRDVFGPLAARLVDGWPLDDVGPPLTDPVRLSLPAAIRVTATEWEARVIAVDRFGNLTTNLTVEHLSGLPSDSRREVAVEIGGASLPLVRTYADVAAGAPCALLGSTGRMEVAVNGASAAERLGAGRGSCLRVKLAAGGPVPASSRPGML